MSNGKRRANWEKVLEAQMQPVHMASMAMQAQITDLQNEIYAMKKNAVHDRYVLIVVIILGVLTAVLK